MTYFAFLPASAFSSLIISAWDVVPSYSYTIGMTPNSTASSSNCQRETKVKTEGKGLLS